MCFWGKKKNLKGNEIKEAGGRNGRRYYQYVPAREPVGQWREQGVEATSELAENRH